MIRPYPSCENGSDQTRTDYGRARRVTRLYQGRLMPVTPRGFTWNQSRAWGYVTARIAVTDLAGVKTEQARPVSRGTNRPQVKGRGSKPTPCPTYRAPGIVPCFSGGHKTALHAVDQPRAWASNCSTRSAYPTTRRSHRPKKKPVSRTPATWRSRRSRPSGSSLSANRQSMIPFPPSVR